MAEISAGGGAWYEDGDLPGEGVCTQPSRVTANLTCDCGWTFSVCFS